METILNALNESQLEAVKKIDDPILILAGAGSGKTRTITSRLAYLVGVVGIDPANTLTLTFTNKAANEMRERALSLLKSANLRVAYPPLLCTFHKFGLLFLKFYINRLGRKNNFIVIDNDDKKRILKSFEIEISTASVANEISHYKNSFITPDIAKEQAEEKRYEIIASLYERYEEYLLQNNLVDFDDLLTLTYKILDEDSILCEEISRRYQYIMVDEYQDTNDLQYKLLKKLCFTHSNICVVGDDDQSIYGWRGANIKNILEFPLMFDNTTIIKLEYNYRSTNEILRAANDLIEHNRSRFGKVLKSTKGKGKEVQFIESSDENQESSIVAKRVKKLIDSGVSPKEIAILYRINALSRSLEEGLNRMHISFKMVGGVKFYERAEIKDLISYLRIITNPHDDFSLLRIINRPKRGLGKVTLDKIIYSANAKKLSIYDFMRQHTELLKEIVSKKSYEKLIEFLEGIENLTAIANNSTYDFIDELERSFGIRQYYKELPDSIERILNIDEFFGLFRDYMKQNPNVAIDLFLNEIALQSEQDQIDGESINIMSVHASKGLEFEHLFVIGLEEGFFPLIGESNDIEEERRLGYVAITRAKKELTLSCSLSRFYKGRRTDLTKSRFLNEAGICGGGLILEKSSEFKKGDLVKHKIFGIGRVTEVTRIKKECKLSINFGGSRRDILSAFVEKI
ncbi:MAG: UvrD-helicase domain-containing protein [Campylobacteraceae bacterium]|jgi:DNA helicase-2/ATP-dependent DNA helicase PcrA|nr:UvrD-helicase domain-containing protein [Campylobacteraceae bacterium]